MKDREYWKARQEQAEDKVYKTSVELIEQYKKHLNDCREQIESKIDKLCCRFMKDNELNYNEANKYLNWQIKDDFKKELEKFIAKCRTTRDVIEKKKMFFEIDVLRTKRKIKKLEWIKAQIDMELIKYAEQYDSSMEDTLKKVYEEVYNSLAKDLGVKTMLDKDLLLDLINTPYLGSNYSQDIWGDTDYLAKVLKKELVDGMITGISVPKLSNRIKTKFMNVGYRNMERLVRTELNHAFNQATLKGYEDAQIEKYEYLATIDNRTSKLCSELHGQRFKIDNAVTGINYPPMHPNCRSTTIPVIDYTSLKKEVESKL